jgi:hypothetical protein
MRWAASRSWSWRCSSAIGSHTTTTMLSWTQRRSVALNHRERRPVLERFRPPRSERLPGHRHLQQHDHARGVEGSRRAMSAATPAQSRDGAWASSQLRTYRVPPGSGGEVRSAGCRLTHQALDGPGGGVRC